MRILSYFCAVLLLFLMCANTSATPEDWPDTSAYIERVRWQPQGQWILFVRQGDDGTERRIYKIRPDGSGLVALSPVGSQDDWPVWSPDGLQIAFVSSKRGASNVYKMDADGSNVTPLGYHPGVISLVRWLSDGRIVFIAGRGDGGPMLGTLHASTGQEDRFWCNANDADWHPSDSRVVVSRVKTDEGIYCNLFEVDLHTKQEHQITFGNEVDDSPRYSPDGEWIVFHSCRDKGGGRNIWLVQRDGSNLHSLPLPDDPTKEESDADFSPDEQYLAFARGDYAPTDLYICRIDGTDLRKITSFYPDDQAKAGGVLKVAKASGKSMPVRSKPAPAQKSQPARPADKKEEKRSSGAPLPWIAPPIPIKKH